MTDLMFSSATNPAAERDRQYNARASVADFEASVSEYATLSDAARRQCVGIFDLHYGLGAAERLDIFPVLHHKRPSPLFIFIHGGYWRAQTKENSALMAKAFTDAGVAVAVVEYPLLPRATLAETVRAVRCAVAWLHRNAAMYGIDATRMYAGGSSAGGHLTGMLMAPGWQDEYALPLDTIRGGLGLSGLYDIRPLCDTHIHEWLRLHPEQAWRLSPMSQLPVLPLPLVLAVGGLETDGFKRQTDAYEHAWRERGLPVTRIEAPQCNHFNLLCELAQTDSELTQAVLDMIDRDRPAR